MDLAQGLAGIPVVRSTTERNTLFPTPATYQRVQNLGTGAIERWDGTQWLTDFTPYATISVAAFEDPAITDGSVFVQAAIAAATALGTTFRGYEVVFTKEYHCATAITAPQNKQITFRGYGRATGIYWTGANNGKMLTFVGGNGGADCKVKIENMAFLVGVQTGVVAITNGSALVTAGCSNFTVRECCFQNVDIGLETFSETDEVVFEDNWLLAYTTAGVRASGGGQNSAYHIEKNHFQGGSDNSWAIDHTGGSVVRVLGNVIESASKVKGVRLNQVADFEVRSQYFESSGALGSTDGPFLDLIECTNGVVETNHTTGDTGDNIIKVGATCTNIRFGPNRHGSSGGTPAVFIAIASGASDIHIIGKQDGATAPYSGTPSTYFAGDALISTKPINYVNSSINLATATPGTIFTVPASTAYRVYCKSGTDGWWTRATVTRVASGNAEIDTPYASNAGIALSVSGNNLRVTHTAGALRTIEFSVSRDF